MLADFGLSKVIEEGATGLTTSDGLKGTLRYYSPELMSESKANHGLSSDIWAWACLALEVRIMGSALAMLPRTEPEGLQALTDEIPYATKNTEQSIIIALMRGELPSDAESLRIHAPDLKDLFAKCWTIQPNERPSAAECLRILNSVLSTSRANTPAERADALESLIQSYFEHDLAFLSRPSSPFPAAADSEWMINSLGGEYIYLAIALYAYTASPDYPREISFSKGDILEIGDISNKWWPARTNDGTIGIAPSSSSIPFQAR
ncbi:Transmembrane osmosensor [Tulasnella sp. 424]|nr:Transmembrane osmosensor [Tulasnella sp. 424]